MEAGGGGEKSKIGRTSVCLGCGAAGGGWARRTEVRPTFFAKGSAAVGTTARDQVTREQARGGGDADGLVGIFADGLVGAGGLAAGGGGDVFQGRLAVGEDAAEFFAESLDFIGGGVAGVAERVLGFGLKALEFFDGGIGGIAEGGGGFFRHGDRGLRMRVADEKGRGCGAQGLRRKTRPTPPVITPTTPRTMSQMLLLVGEPVTALLTEEETESAALSP